MTDDFVVHPKVYRRKRVHEGDDIDETFKGLFEEAERAKRQDAGVLCKACGKRRRWTDIYWQYRSIDGVIIRTWFCCQCLNMLKEDEL